MICTPHTYALPKEGDWPAYTVLALLSKLKAIYIRSFRALVS